MLKLNKTKMAITKDWGKLVHTKLIKVIVNKQLTLT